MAKAKESSFRAVREAKRITPYYQIGILFPDGKKIVKSKCTLEELFETYFINLDKYKGYNAEQLLALYKKTFSEKGIKVAINYMDSWEHLWKGKCAWPRESKFINYLENHV